MNILNFWLASSDILRLGCDIVRHRNLTLLSPICQSTIAEAASASRQGVFGFDGDGQPMHSDWMDGIEAQLKRIGDALGMNDKIDLDVALRGEGAQLLMEFTSPTPRPSTAPKTSWALGLSNLLLGPDQRQPEDDGVRLPIVVLEEPAILGECWEFGGPRGTIGIRLATPVNITALSVDYIPFHRLSSLSRKRAPKSLTLWGLIKASQISKIVPALPIRNRPTQDFLVGTGLPDSVEKDDSFVSLLDVAYELHSDVKQVFVRQDYNLSTDWMYEIVVVEVTDNWGGNSTCLYHIGVHGVGLDTE
jgi:hypothetical protein